MINQLIEFSVHKPLLVFALAVAGCLAGWWSMRHVALGAIPDLSNTQVIICSKWDRSPDLVEEQVTYPISSPPCWGRRVRRCAAAPTSAAPKYHVIFEDGTDIYWARSRTAGCSPSVVSVAAAGVKTELEGRTPPPWSWVFQYVLRRTPARTTTWPASRSARTEYLRYHLRSVPGVAEWPRWAASCSSTESTSTRTGCAPPASPSGGSSGRSKGGNGDAGGRLI
ncbi:MAG: efflux RND transporter permease subunit, partial [Anaeromyxobacter sp.]|nr:efflux RND transporter permease subunit [Anaeromyxobacter sp.]